MVVMTLAMVASNAIVAQNRYQSILDSIGRNSLTFKALTDKYYADSMAAHVGSLVENPELKFGYNWTTDRGVKPTMSLNLSQDIDFPLIFVSQSAIRNLQSHAAALNMNLNQTLLLLEVQHLCAELVYSNAVVSLYERCVENAIVVAKIYKKKIEAGDGNVLDYNRVALDLAESQNKLNVAIAERDVLLTSLRMLNGGKDIAFVQNSYDEVSLAMNFEEWFKRAEEHSPALRCIMNEMDIAQNEVKLARRMWGPELKLGVSGGILQGPDKAASRGVSVGFVLPLWENARAVRTAKVKTIAVQSQLDDARMKLYNQLKALYNKSVALKQNADNLKQAFATYNSVPLLRKALEAGELSLEYYLISIEFYYDAELSIFESQRRLESAILDLNAPLLVVNRE